MNSKKLVLLNILDILKKYTDFNHRLSQNEIAGKLRSEYDMDIERKAVKRNLMSLIEFGYDVGYNTSKRINKQGKEETMYYDWYLNREFDDSELRLLIDGILFNKYIPYNQCNELIKKIGNLSSVHFKNRVQNKNNISKNDIYNKQLFLNIEIIDEAISSNKQIKFNYNNYGVDMKLHPKTNKKGEASDYIVNPYQIAISNGRYYLIGNYDYYSDLGHYRLERISNVEIINKKVKPIEKVKGQENGLNLPKHMAEHIYMFSGEAVNVSFIAKRSILNEIIDWFGSDIVLRNINEDEIEIFVKVNEEAMKYWAIQYGKYVTVISPKSLVEKIKRVTEEIYIKYQ